MNNGMAGRACLALLLGLSVAACSRGGQDTGTAHSTPEHSAFAALSAIPLKLPRLRPEQSCPLSRLSQPGGPHIGMALGTGPVYVVNGDIVGSGHPAKVVYAADPSYSSPIRIRGGRIDGSGQLLFDSFDNRWQGAPVKNVDGSKLAPELDLLESHSTFPNTPPVSMATTFSWWADACVPGRRTAEIPVDGQSSSRR